MLDTVAGVTRIRMLYLQLLYRCNFSCKHCFHGDLLTSSDTFTPAQATAMIDYFRTHYALQGVTLLGGEPLMYPHLTTVARHARTAGLDVEICTNAHLAFQYRLDEVAPYLTKLRVSLDGLATNHDHIRQRGSFAGALRMIDLAADLTIPTGATMTVTADNIDDIVPLARLLEDRGVRELKLHCLRIVGNAAHHLELRPPKADQRERLQQRLADAAELSLTVLYDTDLSPDASPETGSRLRAGGLLDRIESDPRGGLTVSCKASGHRIESFRWDKNSGTITYEPRGNDELAAGIPDVTYLTAA